MVDFGSAKRVRSRDPAEGQRHGLELGSLVGSLPFMAPEVLAQRPYGTACDIWCFGGCLLEMATATPPWSQCRLDNILHAYKVIVQEETSPLAAIGEHDLAPELLDLMAKCLAREPGDRPAAGALLQHPFLTR